MMMMDLRFVTVLVVVVEEILEETLEETLVEIVWLQIRLDLVVRV